jgi:hypothetical protein
MRRKFRVLTVGEKLKMVDIAKHHCTAYHYENINGIQRCHRVEQECADAKCYKREVKSHD